MSARLFVGSLPWATNDEELRNHFAQAGEVTNATVMVDRETGRSRGFGFVEMADDASAQKAIDTLNGSELGPEDNRRAITVDFARPRRDEGNGGDFAPRA